MSEALVTQSEANWNDLPVEARTVVAKFLDKGSRLSLRQCSTTDKRAVDKLPVSIRVLKVCENPETSKLAIVKCEDRDNEPVIIGTRTLEFDAAVSYFTSVFKHKDSTLEMLEVGHFFNNLGIQENQEQVEKFVKQVLKEAEIRKEKYKIEWKIMKLQWNFDIKANLLHEFLSNIDSEYFNELTIAGKFETRQLFETLAELEQWKQLKTIYIKPSFDYNGVLNHFSHMNELILSVEDLQKEEMADFIKNYHSKNVQVHSFFFIQSKTELDENFLQDVSGCFNFTIQNEQHEIKTIDGRIYLKFKMPNNDVNVFSVGVSGNKVIGLICNSQNIAIYLALLEEYIMTRRLILRTDN